MCRCTSKLVITVISVSILICALFLFAVGGFMFVKYHNDHDTLKYGQEVILPASIIVGVGLCLLIMALIGLVGAFKEHRCFLGVFATFLLIVIAGTVSAAVVTFVNRKNISAEIEESIHNDLQKYNSTDEENLTKEIDDLQQNLQCCGTHHYTDWDNTTFGMNQTEKGRHSYPDSCCPNKNCTSTSKPYKEGCYAKVRDGIVEHLNIIAGVIVSFIVLLALGVFFSCVLICRRRSEIPYIGLSEPGAGGMRV